MKQRPRFKLTWTTLAGATGILVALVSAGCGDSGTPASPSVNGPILQSVSPATGTTYGGTVVTIAGTGFVAGATVTFGGTAATAVNVESAQKITATTPAHASGAATVVISGSTGNGTLANAFTYVAPGVTNTPPVVRSIAVQGRRTNEPASFADLSEVVDVVATVDDAETSADKLEYTWTSDVGTFSGTGARMTWTAPARVTGATPVVVTLNLRVTERYQGPDPNGLPVEKTNVVTATSSVSLHDSASEVSTMAYDFLVAFSISSTPTSQVMKDFTPTCSGTADETHDVEKHRVERRVTSYNIGNPSVTVDFGGRCPFRSIRGDACATVPVEWHSTVLIVGDPHYLWTDNTKGFDQVASVYLNGRWWLCESDYNVSWQNFTPPK
ncbi:MAG TPA: IPT/TIG domain-containing protein [Vicinamibacterales bacterium]|jgi:hypothetical protein